VTNGDAVTGWLNPDVIKRRTEMDQPCRGVQCGHARRLHTAITGVHTGPCAMSGCQCQQFVFSKDQEESQ
jgi:hypothetical protein